MKHTEIALARPVTTIVIFVALSLIGLLASRLLPLEMLPDNYREGLVLRFFESLSVAETAAALDCSVANAKVLQFGRVLF